MNFSNFPHPYHENKKNVNSPPQALEKDGSDLGFGSKITNSNQRLLNKDGTPNVIRIGKGLLNPYQGLLEASWGVFFLVVVSYYFLMNVFFALLFLWAGIEHLSGVEIGTPLHNFGEAFFFSVQTFTTTGYGAIHPKGLPANIIASIDAFAGLMTFALATGLFFARFSKPKAQLLYSKNAIITPFQGETALMLRFTKGRKNKLMELNAAVNLSWVDAKEGNLKRHYQPLPLQLKEVYSLPLSWTLVHVITPESPLFGKTKADLLQTQAEILVFIRGFDETFSQTVYSNQSYISNELLWNVKFVPMFEAKNGATVLYLDKISEVVSEK
jgi:inward rectifier potassium channel